MDPDGWLGGDGAARRGGSIVCLPTLFGVHDNRRSQGPVAITSPSRRHAHLREGQRLRRRRGQQTLPAPPHPVALCAALSDVSPGTLPCPGPGVGFHAASRGETRSPVERFHRLSAPAGPSSDRRADMPQDAGLAAETAFSGNARLHAPGRRTNPQNVKFGRAGPVIAYSVMVTIPRQSMTPNTSGVVVAIESLHQGPGTSRRDLSQGQRLRKPTALQPRNQLRGRQSSPGAG